MTEPLYRYLEVALYALLNFLPFMLLALLPFRKQLRFSLPVTGILVACMTAVQIVLGLSAAFCARSHASLLSALSTLLYALFYFTAVKTHWGKSLFTLLMLSNIANFVVVSAKCLEGQIFGDMALELYRWSNSLCMFLVLVLIFPPLAVYFHKIYTAGMQKRSSGAAWRYLWFIPTTFYLTWYWSLYGNGKSGLEVALVPMNSIYLLLVNAGAFLIYHMILRLIHEQDKNIALEEKNHQFSLQSIQYENLKERITEARRAKHDVRHHITLMREYLRKGNYDELERYLNKYQMSLPDDSSIVLCKNYAVNAILVYFGQQAKNYQIDFDVKADLGEPLSISENDLSVVLGNLLENALHACAEQEEGGKRIIVRAKTDRNAIFLAVDNTFIGKMKRGKDESYLTTKATGSGLGLMSVRSITQQYSGVMETEEKDGLFCVSVMLPCP